MSNNVKVYELAKELEMESKELLEKINGMGIEAKSHNSSIPDIDAKAITNMILHSRKKTTETKIVKAAPAKKNSGENEVKVSVKPATVAAKVAREKAKTESKASARRTVDIARESGQAKPPAGVPMPKSASVQPPAGTPMPKSASVQPPVGEPMPKSASVQPPVGEPMPKAASVQPPAGEPMPKSASLQNVKDKDPTPPTKGTSEVTTDPVERTVSGKKERTVQNPAEETPKLQEDKGVKKAPVVETIEERPPVPKGVVIKKRASEIAAEQAAAEQAAKERAEKAAKERAAQEQQGRSRTAGERPARSQQQSAGGERRAPQDSRRPSQGQDSRRPPQGQDSRRPSQGQDSRRPSQGQDSRRPSQGQDSRRPSQSQDSRRPASGRGDSPGIPPRQKKPSAEPVAIDKKERDKKAKDQAYKGKAGKKDFGKKDNKLAFSMEKQAPKKYKKKVEKTVEPESHIDLETLTPGSKIINVPITVKGLSEQIERSASEIIMALMKLGIMANVNQNLDEDTAVLLGTELGVNIVVDKIAEEVVEEGLEIFEDKDCDLESRPPIITVMGHVDHGKTSLLDAIRKTNVTSRESGGITQHIGASEVTVNGQRIVFLDTPGHEAFTAMRARGAHVTDIAVLVVAADDSVKPQTIESISHAKAAGVPIIVAVNKIDKPEANPDRVKQDLANLPADQRVLVEEWGGETISVPVSAKSGEGIRNLLEMILLQAEVLELKANPCRLAMGTVVEARLDKAKGPVATLLVLNGTLQTGMSVVVGTCSGKIRAMTNFKGDKIRKAGPATAVEILGLDGVPEAGDEFNAVKEDRIAREIAEQRRLKVREEVMVRNSSTTLDQLFSQIKEGEVKELNLIIKADVQGSVGALIASLERLQTENVKVKIIHSGVGTITESDIMLASTSDAIIIGFSVRPSTNITTMAEREGVEIRTYRVIYDVIDDVEAAMKGMLDPIFKEVVLGKIEIRNTFKVPGAGVVGGAYVLEGKVQRHAEIRLVRDGIVIHEGKISSLKRFKDDVKEVSQGYECGIGIENYNDIKEGDIIEAFKMEEIAR